ncbi:MAG: DoxX family protein [Bacteroidetes bacterium]|nr:MAG: DoxX family protein [Bacteroidota bacterium]
MATLRSQIQSLEHWADTHHPAWIDLIRMVLGVFIFWKGVIFIKDPSLVTELIQHLHFEFVGLAIAHYIAPAHLIGGLLIAVGLLTRWAVIAQLPILFGAVFLVNPVQGTLSEMWISIVTLVLLLVFAFYGSGKWSVSHLLQKQKQVA